MDILDHSEFQYVLGLYDNQGVPEILAEDEGDDDDTCRRRQGLAMRDLACFQSSGC